jgi:hypothetical protein
MWQAERRKELTVALEDLALLKIVERLLILGVSRFQVTNRKPVAGQTGNRRVRIWIGRSIIGTSEWRARELKSKMKCKQDCAKRPVQFFHLINSPDLNQSCALTFSSKSAST